MPSLLEAQQAIHDALCNAPADSAPGAAGLPVGAVSIHRNNMLHALTRALALGFPAVERLVGTDFFEAMAISFVRQAYPRSAWLDAYGEDFPAFIATFAPSGGLPYLADLARLERAAAVAAMVDPHPALLPADLAGLDTNGAAALRFEAHPSLRLLQSPFPVDALQTATLAADEGTLQRLRLNEPVRLLIRGTLDGAAAEIIRLAEPAFRFTRLLMNGASLGCALQQVPEEADGGTLALLLAGPSFRRASAADAFPEEQPR